MKYLAIEKDSAKEIVNTRQLQSTEYDEGKALVEFLKGGDLEENLLPLAAHKTANGYVITKKSTNEECLVFDLELFRAFQSNNEHETLTIFQKTLRTAIKFWDNIPFSGAEKNNQESGFIILFPHPFNSGYHRVIIDKKPDSKRQEKRNGKHLLVFAYTKNEVNNPPSTTNFRKFIDEAKGIKTLETSKDSGTSPVLISELDGSFSPMDPRIGFDKWQKLLTQAQRKFVFSEHLGAGRIEGPAGTGKTLCLILKSIKTALSNEYRSKKIAFITHSTATREQVTEIINSNLSPSQSEYIERSCPISVFTLQEWCLEKVGSQIDENELLDKDAESSKTYQQILIEEALVEFISKDLSTFSKIISRELAQSLEQDDRVSTIASLMHEISEIIKGRASQKLDAYKKISYSAHALPIFTPQDAECVFSIYRRYQDKLESVGNFDSDDVVISALNQLDSPIWRRRKNKEGYDFVFIDETHLFNLNELSVIHHLLKDESITNVSYSIDRSQSIANSSLTQTQLSDIFSTSSDQQFKTVFRSSPDIIKLAFTILSAGSGIFTTLENPLDKTESSFTQEDEARSTQPTLYKFLDDESVLSNAFKEAEALAERIKSSKARVCIIPCNGNILSELRRIVQTTNKPCEFILKRGDNSLQRKAEKGGKFLVAGIDYVGGLEFDGVVIVGCDKGNFPSTDERTAQTKHFIKHASYNRAYVAITRARYGISVLCSASRGISEILEPAIDNGSLQVIEK